MQKQKRRESINYDLQMLVLDGGYKVLRPDTYTHTPKLKHIAQRDLPK